MGPSLDSEFPECPRLRYKMGAIVKRANPSPIKPPVFFWVNKLCSSLMINPVEVITVTKVAIVAAICTGKLLIAANPAKAINNVVGTNPNQFMEVVLFLKISFTLPTIQILGSFSFGIT